MRSGSGSLQRQLRNPHPASASGDTVPQRRRDGRPCGIEARGAALSEGRARICRNRTARSGPRERARAAIGAVERSRGAARPDAADLHGPAGDYVRHDVHGHHRLIVGLHGPAGRCADVVRRAVRVHRRRHGCRRGEQCQAGAAYRQRAHAHRSRDRQRAGLRPADRRRAARGVDLRRSWWWPATSARHRDADGHAHRPAQSGPRSRRGAALQRAMQIVVGAAFGALVGLLGHQSSVAMAAAMSALLFQSCCCPHCSRQLAAMRRR